MKTKLALLFLPLMLFSEGVVSWRSYVPLGSKTQPHNLFKTIDTPYVYLTSLRTATGLNAFSFNEYLELSSQNHTDYIVNNNHIAHEEYPSYPLFTGENPTKRAFAAGYNSVIGENLSAGQDDFYESIDDLMGAIYHRFGFLDFGYDSVGIGFSQANSSTAYVYNMGNSTLESLCVGESFTGFGSYYSPCKDGDKKVSTLDYDAAYNIPNPDYVIWPYDNYNETPPVFYEESPDPLPNQSVSGYPVSIQFNPNSYPNGIMLESFELFNESQEKLNDVLLIDKMTDSNGRFSDLEFALFPLNRLDWGKVYHAKVVFKNKATQASKTVEWSFKTKSLENDYYILSSITENINLIPNKPYVLYLKPLNNNEWSNGYSLTYDYGVDIQTQYLDLNTLLVTMSGNLNQTAQISLSSGRTVNITLSSSDNAIASNTQNIPLEENNGFDYNLEALSSGWYLFGAVDTINDLTLFDNVDIVWTYTNDQWYVYSNNSQIKDMLLNSSFKDFIITTIEKNSGFWVKK